jgi:hypothetical protein
LAKVLPLLYQRATNGIKYASWQQKLQNWWATENSGRFFCQYLLLYNKINCHRGTEAQKENGQATKPSQLPKLSKPA